jgi:hypothetical protein
MSQKWRFDPKWRIKIRFFDITLRVFNIFQSSFCIQLVLVRRKFCRQKVFQNNQDGDLNWFFHSSQNTKFSKFSQNLSCYFIKLCPKKKLYKLHKESPKKRLESENPWFRIGMWLNVFTNIDPKFTLTGDTWTTIINYDQKYVVVVVHLSLRAVTPPTMHTLLPIMKQQHLSLTMTGSLPWIQHSLMNRTYIYIPTINEWTEKKNQNLKVNNICWRRDYTQNWECWCAQIRIKIFWCKVYLIRHSRMKKQH